MLNLRKVVTNTVQKLCKENYEISMREEHICEIRFDKFWVVLYYSAFEYELMYNYYNPRNKKEFYLENILLGLGCKKEDLPIFKFMSNEEVMSENLQNYFELINKYFKELSDLDKTEKLIQEQPLL